MKILRTCSNQTYQTLPELSLRVYMIVQILCKVCLVDNRFNNKYIPVRGKLEIQ